MPLNATQAAEYCHMSADTLKKHAREGEVKAFKRGRKMVFYKADLDEYLRSSPVCRSTKEHQKVITIADSRLVARKLDALLEPETKRKRKHLSSV